MKLRRLISHEIYKVRQEIDMEGSPDHDWWLAGMFIEQQGNKRFDYDDIYVWFIQLDENMEERTNKEEQWE